MRSYSTTKAYYRYVIPVGKAYQQNAIPMTIPEVESAECVFIQQKKDEILISLSKYFKKEIEKRDVQDSLSKIRQDLTDKCPSYVASSKGGCC